MVKAMVQMRCPKCGQKMEVEVWVGEKEREVGWTQLHYEITMK